MSGTGGRRKHIPQRTCVACRSVRPKRALIRIVRAPTGEIGVDPTGKRSGRGAYLCAQRTCWEEALKRRRLDTALRTTLDEATVAALRAYAQSLPERLEEDSPTAGAGIGSDGCLTPSGSGPGRREDVQ